MWKYVVLSALASGPAPDQLTPARQVRHDKSRLFTETGRHSLHSVRRDIRKMEKDVLSVLSVAERRVLLATLPKLADLE